MWDQNGVLLFTGGMRIARQTGEFYTGTSDGSRVIPELGDLGNSWFLASAVTGGANIPMIRRNGAVLSWEFQPNPQAPNASMLILYGVK